MPPNLALILCAVFVLFLLRLESKQSSGVSHALWIPTIWMLLIASKPLAVWFGEISVNPESGSPWDQFFLIVLLCAGLAVLFSRKFAWSRAVKQNTWLLLLIGYMFASVFWSDVPFLSLKRWTRELIALVMAFVVITEQDPRQAMLSLFRRTIYVLIPFSILLIKYFPMYGVMYGRWSGAPTWIGATLQKNSLGRLCVISAFFLIWTLVRRWRRRETAVRRYQTGIDMFMLFATLWLLKGPGTGAWSATAVASLAGGLAFFAFLLWIQKHRMQLGANTLTAIMALIIFLGIVTFFVGGSTLGAFTSTLGRDETLTGRKEIWTGLLPVAMQQPFLGSGFESFWTPSAREAHDIGEAHSGYLEVVLNLGFAGILFVSMFLLSSGRKAQRMLARDHDWASLWICFLLMALLHNFTESSINSFTSHLTAVLLFLAVSSTAVILRSSNAEREVNGKMRGPEKSPEPLTVLSSGRAR